jgi:starch phosphorylase
MSKASMKSCIPRFNSQRMVVDYVSHFYAQARDHSKRLAENNAEPAQQLAAWKNKVHKSWSNVTIKRTDSPVEQIRNTESLLIRVNTYLDGLEPGDVTVECMFGKLDGDNDFDLVEKFTFEHIGKDGDEHIFELNLKSDLSGLNHYKIRLFPYHELLSHPFELGYMLWV